MAANLSIPQGVATWPGVQQVVSCQVTISHGISPSAFTLEITPQDTPISQTGSLVLTFGSKTLTFPNCKADVANIARTPSGASTWRVTILDRRWKWQFGKIGDPKIHYNKKMGDLNPEPVAATKKDAKEIIEAILLAMAEPDYDTTQVPTGQYPEVIMDYDNPAQKLAEVADAVGCRVIYEPLYERVYVAPAGSGMAYASITIDGTVTEDSRELNPPETPATIACITAEQQWEMRFLLVPVGLDTDGGIKPVADLSYAPVAPATWEDELDGFSGIDDTPTADGKVPQTLAEETVGAWYRMPDTFDVPGWKVGVKRTEVLPILPELVETVTITEDAISKEKRKPAIVQGVYFDDETTGNNTAANTVVNGNEISYSIDAERGIVKFSETLTKLVPGAQATFPTLYLRCIIQGPRYARVKTMDNPTAGAGQKLIRHDEIILTHVVSNAGVDSIQNQAAVDAEADYYNDAEAERYTIAKARSVTYAGLRDDIHMDANVQQVSWQVGPGGAFTRMSWGTEHDLHTMPYGWKRMQEKSAAALLGPSISKVKPLPSYSETILKQAGTLA